MSTSLYKKYRPRKITGIVGQGHVKKCLKNEIETNGSLGHAYLLTGKRGTGKTSIARIMSLIVNGNEKGPSLEYDPKESKVCRLIMEGKCPDVHEMDAATNTSIEDVRNIRKMAKTVPVMCRMRVFIIDEVHRLSGAAADALLKILEDPPETAMFILATTEPSKIAQTIQSRCIRYDLKDLSIKETVLFLRHVAKSEKAKEIKNQAMEMIAKKSGGSLRDALTGLEIVMSHSGGHITPEAVSAVISGDPDPYNYCDIIESLLSMDCKKSISLVKDKTISGTSPSEFFNGLLEMAHDIMLQGAIGENQYLEVSKDIQKRVLEISKKFEIVDIVCLHDVIFEYILMMSDAIRMDILIDTFVIDFINRLEQSKNN